MTLCFVSRSALFGLTLVLSLLAVWPAVPAFAQAQGITLYRVERNEDYERRMRLSRLQTDIGYISTLRGEIPMDGLRLPPRQSEDARPALSETTVTWSSRAALAAIVLLLASILYANRAGLGARFRARADAAPRSSANRGNGGDADDLSAPGPEIVDHLRRIPDRAQALMALTRAVMAAAAHAHGMRLGRAETARGFLDRVPDDWPLRADLYGIVMAEELVRFGGRALSEATFQDCMARGTRILMIPVRRR